MNNNNVLKLLKTPLLASLLFILFWFLSIYMGLVGASYSTLVGVNPQELRVVDFRSFAEFIMMINREYPITLLVMWKGFLANFFSC